MNSLMQEQGPVLEQTQALRYQLMEVLDDEDLTFSPGGDNPTLGGLCREMAEVEQSYIISFQTFEQNFDYRIEEAELESSVAQLAGRFEVMDHELKAALSTLSEEDIQKRLIDRSGGFVIPVMVQVHIYREALLIFYGKVSVYLKALGKTMPEQWQDWIA
jgi:hypothetical protein